MAAEKASSQAQMLAFGDSADAIGSPADATGGFADPVGGHSEPSGRSPLSIPPTCREGMLRRDWMKSVSVCRRSPWHATTARLSARLVHMPSRMRHISIEHTCCTRLLWTLKSDSITLARNTHPCADGRTTRELHAKAGGFRSKTATQ